MQYVQILKPAIHARAHAIHSCDHVLKSALEGTNLKLVDRKCESALQGTSFRLVE
jgi:hypothetical protein